jgi:hypothetical protein
MGVLGSDVASGFHAKTDVGADAAVIVKSGIPELLD